MRLLSLRSERLRRMRSSLLGPGETAASVVVRLVDSNNQSYDVPAEGVLPVQGTDVTQVTFRLPNGLPSRKVHCRNAGAGAVQLLRQFPDPQVRGETDTYLPLLDLSRK